MQKAADIDIVSVSKIYGNTTAVNDISIKIPAGTYCCLLGPSGCGKTSTLRMIAGHETVSIGDIRLGNQVVTDLPPGQARYSDDVPVLCFVSAFEPDRQCCLFSENEGCR